MTHTIRRPTGGGGSGGGTAPRPVVLSGYSSSQLNVINTYLARGHALGAPELAIRAALCAGAGENNWSNEGCNSSGHCGAWQIAQSWQAQQPYSNLEYWTDYAYLHGFYDAGVPGATGGLIGLARANPGQSPGWIANNCQGAYADLAQGAAYYDQFDGQAARILGAAGATGGAVAPSAGSVGQGLASGAATVTGNWAAVFDPLNWAQDLVHAFTNIMGGADEAAHRSWEYRTGKVNKTTVVGVANE